MPQLADRPAVTPARTSPRRSDIARDRSDRQLFARRDAGDMRARDELVERFLPLARSVARRYERGGSDFEDLLQVAAMALVKAVDRYDPARGYAFSSYAVPTIAGELKRHFRDRSWAIRPPRDLQELILRVERATERLTTDLDRAPTVAELAEATQSSDEAVLEALQARQSRHSLSLHAPTAAGEDAVLQDCVGGMDDGFGAAEERADLQELMTFVAPRTRIALRLRFEKDLTQAEIGALLGISQMQVSRIIRRGLDQLRDVAEQREQTFGGGERVAVLA
jgi:RNA polymerase sigma-B factor